MVRLTLALPRESLSVPLVRRVVDSALLVLGVTRECRADIGLAVSEACANAVLHADESLGYEVTIAIEEDRCVVDVADSGLGPDPGRVYEAVAGADDEAGRGLRIISAVADRMEFRRRDPRRARLRIVKTLRRVSPAAV